MKPESSAAVDLARWLGRREGLNMIAGRCSAADAEILRHIRDKRLYRVQSPNWNQFCERELASSGRNINRVIGYLQEFGPQFFHVTQMTRITPQEYRTIAAHVDKAGVKLDGEVVALLPENQEKVASAVGELLRRSEPAAHPKATPTPTLASALKRCEAAAEMLESANDTPSMADQKELARLLMRLRLAGLRFGVIFGA